MSMDSAEWKAAQTGAADRNGSRSLLEIAIEREDWEAAALCLVLGIVEAVRKLPEGGIEEVLALLALDDEPPAHRHLKVPNYITTSPDTYQGSHRRRRGRRRRHGRG